MCSSTSQSFQIMGFLLKLTECNVKSACCRGRREAVAFLEREISPREKGRKEVCKVAVRAKRFSGLVLLLNT